MRSADNCSSWLVSQTAGNRPQMGKSMSNHERRSAEAGSTRLDAMREQFAAKLSSARHASQAKPGMRTEGAPAQTKEQSSGKSPKHASAPARAKRVVRVANACPVNRGRKIEAAAPAITQAQSQQTQAEVSTQAITTASAETASTQTLPSTPQGALDQAMLPKSDSAGQEICDIPSQISQTEAKDEAVSTDPKFARKATPSAARASRSSSQNNAIAHIYEGTVAMNESSESKKVANLIQSTERKSSAKAAQARKAAKRNKRAAAAASTKKRGATLRALTAAALAATLCFGSAASAFGTSQDADPAAGADAAATESTPDIISQETPIVSSTDNAAAGTQGQGAAAEGVDIISTQMRLTDSAGSGNASNTISGTVSMNSDTDVFQADGITYRAVLPQDLAQTYDMTPQAAVIGLTDSMLGQDTVEIPAQVTSNGITYDVVALGERAAGQARSAAAPGADAATKNAHIIGNGAGAYGMTAANAAATKLVLPASLIYIDVDALGALTNLENIEVSADNEVFAGHMGTLLVSDEVAQDTGELTSVRNASAVKLAFIPAAMRNVQLADHVQSIQSEALPYATKAASFHVPEANASFITTNDLLLRAVDADGNTIAPDATNAQADHLAVALRAAGAGTATVIPATVTYNDYTTPVTAIDAGAYAASATTQLTSIVSPAAIESIAERTTVTINDVEEQNTPPAFETATTEKATVALPAGAEDETQATWAAAGFTSFTTIGEAGSQETAGGTQETEDGQVTGDVQLTAPGEELVAGTATAGLTYTLLPDMTVEVGAAISV